MKNEFDVLVVGGGIAGLQASIELADAGLKVCLVEKEVFAGGKAMQLYKAFPTDDCFTCVSATRLKMGIRKCFYRAAIFEHPNITLLTKTSIEEVDGKAGDFKVRVVEKPKYVDPSKCTLCKACLEVCPVTLNDQRFNIQRKAVDIPYPQCIPQMVAIDRLSCRKDCDECVGTCYFKAIDLKAEEKRHVLRIKSIIISTGFNEFASSKLETYGYGNYPNVITQLELARMLDPTGPTQGKVVRISDGKEASDIVMVQCVGSRDENFCSYCSSLCCTYALKHAKIVKEERDAETNIHMIYMDIRTPSQLEKYFTASRKIGIDFIRGRVAQVDELEDRSLDVSAYDNLLCKQLNLNADLLVLSTALIPSNKKFPKINYDDYGFISSDLDSSKTNQEGIFVCGAATQLMDISYSTTTARAAAFNVLNLLRGHGRNG